MWKGPDRPDNDGPDDDGPDNDRPGNGGPGDDWPGDGRAVPDEELAADVAREAQRGLVIGHATFHIPHVEHLHGEFPSTPD